MFGRKPKPEPEFLYRQMQGYAGKGKVAQALAEGWGVVSATPVMFGGTTLKQQQYLLRKENPAWAGREVQDSA